MGTASLINYSGYWTGSIEGTNIGGFAFDLRQGGDKVEGEAKLSEPAMGQYEYIISGNVGDNLSMNLSPGRQTGGLALGNVQVVGALKADALLVGRWKSDIGTEGVFRATRFESKLTPDHLRAILFSLFMVTMTERNIRLHAFLSN